MLSSDIRSALQQLHSVRGQLRAWCHTHKFKYNTLLIFMRTPGRQLEHDTAVAVIDALPAELKAPHLQEAA